MDSDDLQQLEYSLSTLTLDLSLPEDIEPRWGHLSKDSCKVLAAFIDMWLIMSQKKPKERNDRT